MIHSFVGNSSKSLDKFNELHVHVPCLVDLIHVSLHCKVVQRAYLSSSKVIVTDSLECNQLYQTIQSNDLWISWRLCLRKCIVNVPQGFHVLFDYDVAVLVPVSFKAPWMRRICHESVLNELFVEHFYSFRLRHFLLLSESFHRQSDENLKELIPDDLSLWVDANFSSEGEVLSSDSISCNEGQINIG